MSITISETQYVKSGYFGMKSYTQYRVQTSVPCKSMSSHRQR